MQPETCRKRPGIVHNVYSDIRPTVKRPAIGLCANVRPIIINYVNFIDGCIIHGVMRVLYHGCLWLRVVVSLVHGSAGGVHNIGHFWATETRPALDPPPALRAIVYSRPQRRKFIKAPRSPLVGALRGHRRL
jgi:hypothetical protein